MEKIMNYPTLRSFAYSNDTLIRVPVQGIVVSCWGLNATHMCNEDDAFSVTLAEHGIIRIIPYYNPWCWMNRQTVDYIDELVDVLFTQYHLPENLPIVLEGGSMGGLCSLVYTTYAKRTPVACFANCPVCDLPYHYTERPDLPRTLYSAFGTYSDSLQEALESASPIHLVSKMPDIPYSIYHCEEDKAVNKQRHSDRFVAELQKAHTVTYTAVPGRGHCDLGKEMTEQYQNAILTCFGKE